MSLPADRIDGKGLSSLKNQTAKQSKQLKCLSVQLLISRISCENFPLSLLRLRITLVHLVLKVGMPNFTLCCAVNVNSLFAEASNTVEGDSGLVEE